jgi:hypothetical protein
MTAPRRPTGGAAVPVHGGDPYDYYDHTVTFSDNPG